MLFIVYVHKKQLANCAVDESRALYICIKFTVLLHMIKVEAIYIN